MGSGPIPAPAPVDRLRMAELLSALSLAMDLGIGQPLEWVLSACLVGTRFAKLLGLDQAACRDVYYLSFLRHIGCSASASAKADLFGDDLAAASAVMVDPARMGEMIAFLFRTVGKGQPRAAKARLLAKALVAGPAASDSVFRVQCEIGEQMAAALGFGPEVLEGMRQLFERWDGKGTPRKLKGEKIALSVRILSVAQDAATAHRLGGGSQGGTKAAATHLLRRAGSSLDPALARRFASEAAPLLAGLGEGSLWDAVMAAEPGTTLVLEGEALERAMEAVADYSDLKSPFTSGHSRRVADLACRAAAGYGLPNADHRNLRWMGYLHDLGKVGVSAGLWNKAGKLAEGEWERVRLHSHFTERIFARVPRLADLAAAAALDHERMDGSGYPRRPPASLLPASARLLAAADVFAALTEARPHRPARDTREAAEELRAEVKAGRLDGKAAEAVLAAAGEGKRDRRTAIAATGASALSEREIEVLRLAARGLPNKEIAKTLGISSRTAEHHMQHIFGKIGASSRAGATLYAMRNGFLE